MEIADAAHLLKRASLVITPELVDRLAPLSPEEALHLLVNSAIAPDVGRLRFRNVYGESEDDDFADLLRHELRRLAEAGGAFETALGNRMLWFWHSLLTTSFDKIALPALLFRQHQLLARHALGNFRDLIEELTIDVGMLIYLDGNFSFGANPNENYAREVMELFTLGKAPLYYTQADVRAAAVGFSGWYVNGFPERLEERFNADQITAEFNPEWSFAGAVEFLGAPLKLDGSREQYQHLIRRIFAFEPKPGTHPVAEHIVKRLFQYFVLPRPDEASVVRLAAVFHDSDYNIQTLLNALFRNRFFLSAQQRRARFPLESLLAIAATMATPVTDFDYLDYFDRTGQAPFNPPNVAGWNVGNRWVSSSHMLARARLGLRALDLSPRNPALRAIKRATDPVGETLRWLSLYQVSDTTRNELQRIADSIRDRDFRARALLAVGAVVPEYALS